jgi:chromosomal replication initiator protein
MQDVNGCDKEIVSTLRRALADRIGAERYDLWFAATTRFDLAQDRLTVAVPNTFIQDWLRTHFRNPLEATARELLGPSAMVGFEVDPQFAARRGADPAETAAADPTPIAAQPSSSDRVVAGAAAGTSLRVVRDEPAPTPRPKRVTAPRRLGEFDEFVVGTTNRLAYTAALDVVERLGRISPLFLHGPTGVGKTHLLEAMVTAAQRQNTEARTAYLTAEQFTTEFLEALHGRGLPNFRRKFRDLHLLVLDDLQFFEGKRATLVEFVHTLDVLQRDGRQVVVTADRPPEQLGFLGPEIRNRLTSGLACRVEAPDMTTRLGIASNLAVKLGLNLPDDVRHYVATHFSAHAREVAGALKRLVIAMRAYDRPLDLPLAEQALDELLRNRRKAVRLADIERAVCDVFGLEADALQSARKGKEVSQPRMLAMWLARKYTRSALSEIGTFFGGRSHSTVISANKKVDSWMTTREPLRLAVGKCPFDEAVRRVEETLLGAVG